MYASRCVRFVCCVSVECVCVCCVLLEVKEIEFRQHGDDKIQSEYGKDDREKCLIIHIHGTQISHKEK